MLQSTAINNTLADLGIPRFARYWHYSLLSAATAFFIQRASPAISSRIFGQKYDSLRSDQKSKWAVQLVSLIHAIEACYMAYLVLGSESLNDDPIFGHDRIAELAFAITIGYFVWDVFICTTNFRSYGLPFTMHALAGLTGGFILYKPLFQHCATNILLFEITTIFLNIYWFMDKLELTGSIAQLVVAIGLIFSYLCVRLIFGTYLFVKTLYYLYISESQTPKLNIYICFFAFGATFSYLNFTWFFQIIRSAAKRFNFSIGGTTNTATTASHTKKD